MRHADLFAGIGGFRLAFQRAGFKCVWACEIDRFAREVYEARFKTDHPFPDDVTKVEADDIPDHDVLTAGFPCQAFSTIGRRRGFEDTRGTLFFEVCRVLRAKRSPVVVLENVKGLLNHDCGETFRIVLKSLEELGYDCEWQVLDSRSFGIPQRRERVFLIGYSRAKGRSFIFPTAHEGDPAKTRSNLQLRLPCCNTLITSYKTGSCNIVLCEEGYRWLTPLESERLQGFPDGWTEGIPEAERYRCLGNAVTVDVASAVAKLLKRAVFTTR